MQSQTQTTKNKKNLKLGKGLASLFESNTSDELAGISMKDLKQTVKNHVEGTAELPKKNVAEKKVVEVEHTPLMVPLSKIQVNPYQPRKIFKEKDIEELSLSIEENGLIQPIIVSETEDGNFEIISGERRFRASKKAGLDQVPVVVKRATDRERLVFAIIENVQRSDLNCVEEALAYYQLMDEFKLTQEEVAKKIGKERSTIANFLRLLKLPREVVEMLNKEDLSFGHAKVLGGIKEQDKCTRIARQIVAEQLSVRQAEELIRKERKPAKQKQNSFFDEKLDSLKRSLEQKTGFHFQIKNATNGSGHITIKYNNEAEFNDVFEYLMKH